MSKKLKVGIVGCGVIAEHQHIPSFLRLKDNVIVQAICDKNKSLGLETAFRFGIPKVYSSLSDMLAKEDLDIVDICTPPQAHATIGVEALEYGCHLLMEKPMALTVSDCDLMISTATKSGVKLGIVHNILFSSPIPEARKLIAEGAIGDFIGMRILASDPREAMIMKKDHWIHKLPGGLIGETGPHVVYTSLAFIGKVKDVSVHAKNFLEHPWAPFDEFRIELEGEKAVSSITVSYAGNRRNFYVDLFGTEGALYLDITGMLMVRQGKKDSMAPTVFVRYMADLASQVARGVVSKGFRLATRQVRYAHSTVIEQFVDSILNNHQPPVTGEDGREATKAMEMIVADLHQRYPLEDKSGKEQ